MTKALIAKRRELLHSAHSIEEQLRENYSKQFDASSAVKTWLNDLRASEKTWLSLDKYEDENNIDAAELDYTRLNAYLKDKHQCFIDFAINCLISL